MKHSTRLADLLQLTFALNRDPLDCLVADREFIGAERFAWLKPITSPSTSESGTT